MTTKIKSPHEAVLTVEAFCVVSCTIRTPLDICNFNLLLKKATAVAETSNITFLASVNFLIFFNVRKSMSLFWPLIFAVELTMNKI